MLVWRRECLLPTDVLDLCASIIAHGHACQVTTRCTALCSPPLSCNSFGIVMFGDIATRFDGSLRASVALFAVRTVGPTAAAPR